MNNKMSSYGHVLDPDYNPTYSQIRKSNPKNRIYDMFAEYFDNPFMTKIEDTNEGSLYFSKIHSLLSRDYRYLVAFVPRNQSKPGTQRVLSQLNWFSFQTRTLPDNYTIDTHNYGIKQGPPMNDRIYILNRTEDYATYTSKVLPIKIKLLSVKKGKYEYGERGTLAAALETYNTIITF
jgi:hypothetical protein